MSVLPFAPSPVPPQPAVYVDGASVPPPFPPPPAAEVRTSVVVEFPTYRERWADATASVRRLTDGDDAVDMLVIAVETDGKVKHVYHPLPSVVSWRLEPFVPISWGYRGAL